MVVFKVNRLIREGGKMSPDIEFSLGNAGLESALCFYTFIL